jgi:hypothetical protein
MILLFLDVSIETLRAIPETESFDGLNIPPVIIFLEYVAANLAWLLFPLPAA